MLHQAARLVGIGILAGLAGYLALSRVVGQLLFGVSAVDPGMLLIAPIALALAAFIAAVLPARRASRADPMIALKAD